MGKSVTGHHWRLMCKTGDCTWSKGVDDVPEDDAEAVLLVVLRAHADIALHGRRIEGVAVGLNRQGDPQTIVLRHP